MIIYIFQGNYAIWENNASHRSYRLFGKIHSARNSKLPFKLLVRERVIEEILKTM